MECCFFDTPFEITRLHLVVAVEEKCHRADSACVDRWNHRTGDDRQARKRHAWKDEGKPTGGCSKRDRATTSRLTGWWSHGRIVSEYQRVVVAVEVSGTQTIVAFKTLLLRLSSVSFAAMQAAVAVAQQKSIPATY